MRREYRENHGKAWAYFVYIGKIPVDAKPREWCLHHTDTSLRKNDPDRYNEWRVEDLEPMTTRDHMLLHYKLRGGFSEEARRRSGESKRGVPRSEETKKRVSEGLRRYWEKFYEEHPDKKPKEPVPREIANEHRAKGIREFWKSSASDELRRKVSEKFKTIERSKEWYEKVSRSLNKKVQMLNDDGSVLNEFESLKKASEFLGKKSPANLSTAIKTGSRYCGYFFRYR